MILFCRPFSWIIFQTSHWILSHHTRVCRGRHSCSKRLMAVSTCGRNWKSALHWGGGGHWQSCTRSPIYPSVWSWNALRHSPAHPPTLSLPHSLTHSITHSPRHRRCWPQSPLAADAASPCGCVWTYEAASATVKGGSFLSSSPPLLSAAALVNGSSVGDGAADDFCARGEPKSSARRSV